MRKTSIAMAVAILLSSVTSAGVMKCVGPGGQVTYAESCPGGKSVEIRDNSLPADGYREYQAKQAEKAAAKAEARAQAAKAPHVNCTAPTVRVDGFGRILTAPPVCVTN